MVWSLDLDDFSGKFCRNGRYPLLNEINSEFKGIQQIKTGVREPGIGQIQGAWKSLNTVTSRPVNPSLQGDGGLTIKSVGIGSNMLEPGLSSQTGTEGRLIISGASMDGQVTGSQTGTMPGMFEAGMRIDGSARMMPEPGLSSQTGMRIDGSAGMMPEPGLSSQTGIRIDESSGMMTEPGLSSQTGIRIDGSSGMMTEPGLSSQTGMRIDGSAGMMPEPGLSSHTGIRIDESSGMMTEPGLSSQTGMRIDGSGGMMMGPGLSTQAEMRKDGSGGMMTEPGFSTQAVMRKDGSGGMMTEPGFSSQAGRRIDGSGGMITEPDLSSQAGMRKDKNVGMMTEPGLSSQTGMRIDGSDGMMSEPGFSSQAGMRIDKSIGMMTEPGLSSQAGMRSDGMGGMMTASGLSSQKGMRIDGSDGMMPELGLSSQTGIRIDGSGGMMTEPGLSSQTGMRIDGSGGMMTEPGLSSQTGMRIDGSGGMMTGLGLSTQAVMRIDGSGGMMPEPGFSSQAGMRIDKSIGMMTEPGLSSQAGMRSDGMGGMMTASGLSSQTGMRIDGSGGVMPELGLSSQTGIRIDGSGGMMTEPGLSSQTGIRIDGSVGMMTEPGFSSQTGMRIDGSDGMMPEPGLSSQTGMRIDGSGGMMTGLGLSTQAEMRKDGSGGMMMTEPGFSSQAGRRIDESGGMITEPDLSSQAGMRIDKNVGMMTEPGLSSQAGMRSDGMGGMMTASGLSSQTGMRIDGSDGMMPEPGFSSQTGMRIDKSNGMMTEPGLSSQAGMRSDGMGGMMTATGLSSQTGKRIDGSDGMMPEPGLSSQTGIRIDGSGGMMTEPGLSSQTGMRIDESVGMMTGLGLSTQAEMRKDGSVGMMTEPGFSSQAGRQIDGSGGMIPEPDLSSQAGMRIDESVGMMTEPDLSSQAGMGIDGSVGIMTEQGLSSQTGMQIDGSGGMMLEPGFSSQTGMRIDGSGGMMMGPGLSTQAEMRIDGSGGMMTEPGFSSQARMRIDGSGGMMTEPDLSSQAGMRIDESVGMMTEPDLSSQAGMRIDGSGRMMPERKVNRGLESSQIVEGSAETPGKLVIGTVDRSIVDAQTRTGAGITDKRIAGSQTGIKDGMLKDGIVHQSIAGAQIDHRSGIFETGAHSGFAGGNLLSTHTGMDGGMLDSGIVDGSLGGIQTGISHRVIDKGTIERPIVGETLGTTGIIYDSGTINKPIMVEQTGKAGTQPETSFGMFDSGIVDRQFSGSQTRTTGGLLENGSIDGSIMGAQNRMASGIFKSGTMDGTFASAQRGAADGMVGGTIDHGIIDGTITDAQTGTQGGVFASSTVDIPLVKAVGDVQGTVVGVGPFKGTFVATAFEDGTVQGTTEGSAAEGGPFKGNIIGNWMRSKETNDLSFTGTAKGSVVGFGSFEGSIIDGAASVNGLVTGKIEGSGPGGARLFGTVKGNLVPTQNGRLQFGNLIGGMLVDKHIKKQTDAIIKGGTVEGRLGTRGTIDGVSMPSHKGTTDVRFESGTFGGPREGVETKSLDAIVRTGSVGGTIAGTQPEASFEMFDSGIIDRQFSGSQTGTAGGLLESGSIDRSIMGAQNEMASGIFESGNIQSDIRFEGTGLQTSTPEKRRQINTFETGTPGQGFLGMSTFERSGAAKSKVDIPSGWVFETSKTTDAGTGSDGLGSVGVIPSNNIGGIDRGTKVVHGSFVVQPVRDSSVHLVNRGSMTIGDASGIQTRPADVSAGFANDAFALSSGDISSKVQTSDFKRKSQDLSFIDTMPRTTDIHEGTVRIGNIKKAATHPDIDGSMTMFTNSATGGSFIGSAEQGSSATTSGAITFPGHSAEVRVTSQPIEKAGTEFGISGIQIVKSDGLHPENRLPGSKTAGFSEATGHKMQTGPDFSSSLFQKQSPTESRLFQFGSNTRKGPQFQAGIHIVKSDVAGFGESSFTTDSRPVVNKPKSTVGISAFSRDQTGTQFLDGTTFDQRGTIGSGSGGRVISSYTLHDPVISPLFSWSGTAPPPGSGEIGSYNAGNVMTDLSMDRTETQYIQPISKAKSSFTEWKGVPRDVVSSQMGDLVGSQNPGDIQLGDKLFSRAGIDSAASNTNAGVITGVEFQSRKIGSQMQKTEGGQVVPNLQTSRMEIGGGAFDIGSFNGVNPHGMQGTSPQDIHFPVRDGLNPDGMQGTSPQDMHFPVRGSGGRLKLSGGSVTDSDLITGNTGFGATGSKSTDINIIKQQGMDSGRIRADQPTVVIAASRTDKSIEPQIGQSPGHGQFESGVFSTSQGLDIIPGDSRQLRSGSIQEGTLQMTGPGAFKSGGDALLANKPLDSGIQVVGDRTNLMQAGFGASNARDMPLDASGIVSKEGFISTGEGGLTVAGSFPASSKNDMMFPSQAGIIHPAKTESVMTGGITLDNTPAMHVQGGEINFMAADKGSVSPSAKTSDARFSIEGAHSFGAGLPTFENRLTKQVSGQINLGGERSQVHDTSFNIPQTGQGQAQIFTVQSDKPTIIRKELDPLVGPGGVHGTPQMVHMQSPTKTGATIEHRNFIIDNPFGQSQLTDTQLQGEGNIVLSTHDQLPGERRAMPGSLNDGGIMQTNPQGEALQAQDRMIQFSVPVSKNAQASEMQFNAGQTNMKTVDFSPVADSMSQRSSGSASGSTDTGATNAAFNVDGQASPDRTFFPIDNQLSSNANIGASGQTQVFKSMTSNSQLTGADHGSFAQGATDERLRNLPMKEPSRALETGNANLIQTSIAEGTHRSDGPLTQPTKTSGWAWSRRHYRLDPIVPFKESHFQGSRMNTQRVGLNGGGPANSQNVLSMATREFAPNNPAIMRKRIIRQQNTNGRINELNARQWSIPDTKMTNNLGTNLLNGKGSRTGSIVSNTQQIDSPSASTVGISTKAVPKRRNCEPGSLICLTHINKVVLRKSDGKDTVGVWEKTANAEKVSKPNV